MLRIRFHGDKKTHEAWLLLRQQIFLVVLSMLSFSVLALPENPQVSRCSRNVSQADLSKGIGERHYHCLSGSRLEAGGIGHVPIPLHLREVKVGGERLKAELPLIGGEYLVRPGESLLTVARHLREYLVEAPVDISADEAGKALAAAVALLNPDCFGGDLDKLRANCKMNLPSRIKASEVALFGNLYPLQRMRFFSEYQCPLLRGLGHAWSPAIRRWGCGYGSLSEDGAGSGGERAN